MKKKERQQARQGAGVWVGMWPPSLRQTLKSLFENIKNYANALTNETEKKLILFRKALKEVSKALAEAVLELWIERAEEIKLIEQTEQAQSEPDQQQWRRTPLPSNQRTIELFCQFPTPTPTPTPPTPTITVNSQITQNKNKTYFRLKPGRLKTCTTYKIPKVRRSMEGYI